MADYSGMTMIKQDGEAPMNIWIKLGAAMFFLWGLLHVYAGGLMSVPFFTVGPGANLAVVGFAVGEPLSPFERVASHITLNFGLDLAGYGILAIWCAANLLRNRNVFFSFALLVVMLGISDGAFIYSLLLPGYSPLIEGLPGPILYALGVPLTVKGLFFSERNLQ